MKKIIVFIFVIFLGCLLSSLSEAKCGYYAGYGYRCFGDEGGTGGKVFKQMDENTKKCGYWDPGCQKSGKSTGNYKAPKSDKKYKSPTVGPGYKKPSTK